MTVQELIKELSQFNPTTEVVVMTHESTDNYTDYKNISVHDLFNRGETGDMVSVEIDLVEDRPELWHRSQ